MKEYEKIIGLRTIYLTVVRRFKYFLFIFLPILISSFVVTNFIMTKTYQSSATMSKTSIFSSPHYQSLQLSLKDKELHLSVVESLNNNQIKHFDNSPITAEEISSGIHFGDLGYNAISVSFYFQSTDKTIVQPVLEELSKQSVEILKQQPDFTTLFISSSASAPYKNSKENRYFLIGAGIGFVAAFAVSFVIEVASDNVYDRRDLKTYGIDAFDLHV